MSDERPDALLKSALEKIVYFEARSKQLENDVTAARAETERLKAELAAAGQREIELRRHVAGIEVELTRSHRERDELARLNATLRAERTSVLEQLIESAQIHGPGAGEDTPIDLAAFISQLRSEALDVAKAKAAAKVEPATVEEASFEFASTVGYAVSSRSHPAWAAHVVPSSVAKVSTSGAAPAPASASAKSAVAVATIAPVATGVSAHAERLLAEGRLKVSTEDVERLSVASAFPGRTEETLFGFSVRELSAPDASARVRAAERLRALGQSAAAPALAAALHAERDPSAQVALLGAFGELAKQEGAAVVLPLLDAPAADVRVGALKALLKLDATQAGPHLSAAMKDADRAVRRRASLLALGLEGEAARSLGEQAVRDDDAEVRALGARVLGASGGEPARALLLTALRDPERKVRKAAAESLSRILGEDLSVVVDLDDPQRRREVRRLATLPVKPVHPRMITVQSRGDTAVRGAEMDRPNHVGVRGPSAALTAEPAQARAGDSPVRALSAEPAQAYADEASMQTVSAEPAPARAHAENARVRGSRGLAAAMAGMQLVPTHEVDSQDSGTAAVDVSTVAEAVPRSDVAAPERLCASLATELRISIRGRTVAELASITNEPAPAVTDACELLVARGQAVKRGKKFFAA